ncbi:hypothetical protein [Reichenbachiella ulvae]|uniref:Anti-sigma factor n=1 Tax=Reichenbachiella ulvae TaxID=2980104 RepID=A0ABT3CYA7_9BACT|nr:hypothetical protein [Reichenbachiella ulvae]MCV9388685.1 hypothetical protein [Reichenbachiella ulvae]
MVQDDWKDHIEKNRSEFEQYELDQDSWANIVSGLDKKEKSLEKRSKWLGNLWKGAAACMLAAVVAFVLYPVEQSDDYASSQLSEVETYYQSKINIKVSQISAIENDQTIFQDLEVLDQAFVELKEDLKDNADNEEVINAMIATYKVKLEVLERILEELEDKKKKVDA